MDTFFGVEDHVIVTNPTDEDYTFTVGGEREYIVKTGQVKRLQGVAARLYVKHMTDALIIQSNQTPRLHDEALRKEMADRLIVRIIKDDEDVDEEEVLNLVQQAKQNDVAPIKEAEEFPEIRKSEVIKDKEIKSEQAETERQPAAKPAESGKAAESNA